ncbi:MAG: hypothetical protein A3G52_03095 [Candidatus Taylorbacteria bacterium RIFCSPLOWO2_12_FULL_43_20]|uniref:Uncharacterized protein n=1 Tax=Candidatus Taylorbacteria bacterium RIFCSPLOWO2_12_FULL_43_20 TaxID=1802332 RepID=A0A1G2P352_9BACT|nr:MAG: hypothetical protein A2825_03750 [Candidatus Taylorbacteria bacterium RIFCSPHIGHO2_01_FULL_43_120]OHA22061.1 MAG: hypothetical protein A3B98_04135 [Candidatus Taylorbacteria bacterium RIFCSPHIGHO2_02_FULL_43_55]OHA30360.1 MAG: hypothetical protein A3E92_00640 [Candidatus Taylorbacteria bacterium RIFCSPHIGHO2_12_FULL_42_34]OHA31034.1 MAG: hypothetical protein A3B09_04080 [Candidatus Taylorbacteria bacterium RIFCSPLOWO2_01_FULL_43_83]OHA39730.1 MAG: hypothetical protein A3H58_04720 [Candi
MQTPCLQILARAYYTALVQKRSLIEFREIAYEIHRILLEMDLEDHVHHICRQMTDEQVKDFGEIYLQGEESAKDYLRSLPFVAEAFHTKETQAA